MSDDIDTLIEYVSNISDDFEVEVPEVNGDTGYATHDYKIVVGRNAQGDLLYEIVNRGYDVTEQVAFQLPQAIGLLLRFQKKLDGMVQKYRHPDLYPIGESDEGKTGLH